MDLNAQIAAVKEAHRRRKQALAMFRRGVKYKEIGEALGITRERARQLVAKAIKEQAPEQ